MSKINEIEDEEKGKNQQLIKDPENLKEYCSGKIKLLYVLTVGIVLLIIVIIGIIVIYIGNNKNNNNNNSDDNGNNNKNDTEPEIEPLITSSIKAIYQTLNDGDSIKLINENLLDKISSMHIDNKKVKISNIYTFNDKGEYIPKNK